MELAGLEPATSWVRFKSAPAANPLPERLSGHSRARKSLRYPTLIRGFWGWSALHPQNDRGRRRAAASMRIAGARAWSAAALGPRRERSSRVRSGHARPGLAGMAPWDRLAVL